MKKYPLEKKIEHYTRIVKLTFMQGGVDTTTMSQDEMKMLDQLITSIVTAVVLYQSFESIQDRLLED